MKVKGKFPADIVGFTIKRNQQHDGREAYVDLEVGVREDEATDRFGEDFRLLAFATMRITDDEDGTRAPRFLQDVIKPGSEIVFERHLVQLAGAKVDCQPQLLTIRTVKGEARVVAKIRIPIDVSNDALLTELMQNVGKSTKTNFDPKQQNLPLITKKKGKAPEEAAEAN